MQEYIIKNHDKYGIHNEDGELLSEKEMRQLLQILDLFGENLDTFHDVQNQGYTDFCGIVGIFANDDDTYEAITEFHNYIEQKDINRFFLNVLDNYIYSQDEEYQTIEEFKRDFEEYTIEELDIVEGGLVHHIDC